MRAYCPNCEGQLDLGVRVGAKIGGAIAGAAIGGMTKNPLLVLLGMALGALLGHVADNEILPHCPKCRAALRAIDATL